MTKPAWHCPESIAAAEILFRDGLPPLSELAQSSLLIFDQHLLALDRPALTDWISSHPAAYPVVAGESLKELARFPAHAEALCRLAATCPTGSLRIVAMGGGSVGDFAGFFASVLHRGVDLWQIPSTWLAALDSAHGGKNALNVDGVKNQMGTFYGAQRIYLIRDLLLTQPPVRAQESLAELAKICLLDGGDWVDALGAAGPLTPPLLWDALPLAIEAKLRFVRRDPLERTGDRHLLNLGHTLGHVLEAVHLVPHGVAVAQGLRFALDWSLDTEILSGREHARLLEWLERCFALLDRRDLFPPIAEDRFRQILRADKKRVADDAIRFVFLAGRGQPQVQLMTTDAIVAEAKRQGYVA